VNLWKLFPECLLNVDGILLTPYVTILVYLYVVYAMVKYAGQRIYLTVFVLLTLMASVIMLKNMGPQAGKIIPPSALLTVMMMPIVLLGINLYKKDYSVACVWFAATVAGWLHSISWSVWLFVLARS